MVGEGDEEPWAASATLRVDALTRHYSQAVLRNRKWARGCVGLPAIASDSDDGGDDDDGNDDDQGNDDDDEANDEEENEEGEEGAAPLKRPAAVMKRPSAARAAAKSRPLRVSLHHMILSTIMLVMHQVQKHSST